MTLAKTLFPRGLGPDRLGPFWRLLACREPQGWIYSRAGNQLPVVCTRRGFHVGEDLKAGDLLWTEMRSRLLLSSISCRLGERGHAVHVFRP